MSGFYFASPSPTIDKFYQSRELDGLVCTSNNMDRCCGERTELMRSAGRGFFWTFIPDASHQQGADDGEWNDAEDPD